MTTRHSEKAVVILQADDDEEDQMMTIKALKEISNNIDVRTVFNGEELLDYLKNKGEYEYNAPRPGIILLDLNMPIMDGREALDQIKKDKLLRHIPVIVLTTSKDEEEVQYAYSQGANAYMTKPVKHTEYVTAMEALKKFWVEVASIPPACELMHQRA